MAIRDLPGVGADYPHLQRFFEIIVLAGEHGVPPKPASAPFQICLDFLGIEAAEAAFVGDDWKNDICGARSMGIHPIWLQHYSVSRNWPNVSMDVPIIQRLDALLELGKLLP